MLSVGCLHCTIGVSILWLLLNRTAVLKITFGNIFHTLRWTGGAVAKWVRALAWTGDRVVLARFGSRCGNLIRFRTLAIPFTPLCECLLEETLKAVGPFYLVSMPGEVKYPTSPHWKCVAVVDSTTHPHCGIGVLPIITQDKTPSAPNDIPNRIYPVPLLQHASL